MTGDRELSPSVQPERYLFDNAWQQADDRLHWLETLWDSQSRQQIEALPFRPGWHCLEVGAGAGSIASWLCGKVPEGKVVATDTDTRFLDVLNHANLEVRNHDIVNDDLEDATYDFVHARLVLSHLPQRDKALRQMVRALKPGGWILIEEFDHSPFLLPGSQEAERASRAIRKAFLSLATNRGLDVTYGRRLTHLLSGCALDEVEAEGRMIIGRGGSSLTRFWALSLSQVKEHLTATHLATELEVDTLLRMLPNPAFSWMSQLMVFARGRKPEPA